MTSLPARCTDECHARLLVVTPRPATFHAGCDTKITQLHIPITVNQDIAGLRVRVCEPWQTSSAAVRTVTNQERHAFMMASTWRRVKVQEIYDSAVYHAVDSCLDARREM
jgi:hypothetical protein